MSHKTFVRFLLLLCAITGAPLTAATQMKGLIDVPAALEATPEFTILFDGQQVYCGDDGFFSFPLEDQLRSLSLLVCEDIQVKFSSRDDKTSNTIEGLSIPSDIPHYFARLSGRGDGSVFWKKTELENGSVPADCIVVLANPDMVHKTERLNLDASLGLVSGPKISFVADEETIRLSSIRSLAKCTDLVRYFKSSKQKEEWKEGTKLSITA